MSRRPLGVIRQKFRREMALSGYCRPQTDASASLLTQVNIIPFIEAMKTWNDVKTVLLLCLTLGLAPFFPEPHLWGKLRWLLGGAVGMQPVDWLDLFMHGFPWVLLLRWGWLRAVNFFRHNSLRYL